MTFFKPFQFVGGVFKGTKAHMSFLMIEEESPFFDRGVKKEKKLKACVITYIFEKKDWNIVRVRYKISLKAPLESSAFIAVCALIAATAAAKAAATAPTPVVTTTPIVTTTPLCFITCTCFNANCHLK